MAPAEQFSLRWNNFHSNLTSGFHELLKAHDMVDVTLAVEGQFLQAHKIVLSICSPFFKQLFLVNPCKHPIVILNNVTFENLKDILQFMYLGEVNIVKENLSSFLRTAELLHVKGLTGDDSETSDNSLEERNVEKIPSKLSSASTRIKRSQPPQLVSSKRQRQESSYSYQTSYDYPKNMSSNVNGDESGYIELTSLKIKPYSDLSLSIQENEDHLTKNLISDDLELKISQPLSAQDSNHDNDGRNSALTISRHPFQCEKCTKRFSRRDHLRTHEKNIHGEDAGPFACIICSQLYKNSESLRKHIAKFHYSKLNEGQHKIQPPE